MTDPRTAIVVVSRRMTPSSSALDAPSAARIANSRKRCVAPHAVEALDTLAERVLPGPHRGGKSIIDDGDGRGAGIVTFGEGASAAEWDTEGAEVIRSRRPRIDRRDLFDRAGGALDVNLHRLISSERQPIHHSRARHGREC